jgi:two-component system, cell cycle response regulator
LTNEILANDLKILEKYYDAVRIVDPLAIKSGNPTVHPVVNGSLQDYAACYPRENSDQNCKNYISMKAIQLNESIIKIEVLEGKCFVITAIPLEIEGRTIALELMKCISDNTLESILTMPEKTANMYHSIAKLNDLAIRDTLTNIYNRRYIDQQLLVEIAQARQHNLPFSIVMTDIDYFKQFNDQFGHLVGDEVLKCFATYLQNNIRQCSGDWVARYGGEEFLIVLINCSKSQAYKISEKLRKIIAHTTFHTTAGNLYVKASFGVYTFSGQEDNVHQLIDKVDRYLYQAKQAGRNCTVSD